MVRALAVLAFAVAVLMSTLSGYGADRGRQNQQQMRAGQQMPMENEGSLLGVIQKDHRAVQQILQDLTQSDDTDEMPEMVQQLRQALLPHMQAEEKLFYPAIKADGRKGLPVMEANEEHQMAKMMLVKLENGKPDDPMYQVRLKILSDMLNNHIQEEESVLFPMARDEMEDDEMKQMLQEFMTAKQQADPQQVLQEAQQKEMQNLPRMIRQRAASKTGRADRPMGGVEGKADMPGNQMEAGAEEQQ